jgi:cell division protein FtsW
LLYTLLFGTTVNEASRWYTLPGINISFQPSDLAKLALIMFLARLLTKKQDDIKDFKVGFLPVTIPVLIVCGLILWANFSTAAILFVTSLVLMFIGRVRMKYIFSMIGLGCVILIIFYLGGQKLHHVGRVETWSHRIESFVNGSSGEAARYQPEQAMIAIANGGILGVMPGNSTQKNFLPQAYSDYIYAIIIEEFGIIGGFIVLLMYMILLYRAVRIVIRCPRHFGAFLAIGLAFSLVFQALINMAVAVHLLPVTGQTLPLVSMGGTSLWFTSIAIGIILSVSRDIETNSPETAVYAEG